MARVAEYPPVHQCECAVCQAGQNVQIQTHHAQLNLFMSRLSEPQRRWYVGLLSQEPDGASDSELARMTGLDRNTIRRGRQELEAGLCALPPNRQRQPRGGRMAAQKKMWPS